MVAKPMGPVISPKTSNDFKDLEGVAKTFIPMYSAEAGNEPSSTFSNETKAAKPTAGAAG